jgi:hypothetical protein
LDAKNMKISSDNEIHHEELGVVAWNTRGET